MNEHPSEFDDALRGQSDSPQDEALHSLMQQWKAPEVSGDFTLNVMSRIAEERHRAPTLWERWVALTQTRMWVPAPVGAMAVLALVVSVSINIAMWSQPGTPAVAPINGMGYYAAGQNGANGSSQPIEPLLSPNEAILVHPRSLPREWVGVGSFLLVPVPLNQAVPLQPNVSLDVEEQTEL